MPRPGMKWRHIIISTHNSWLPGDSRGFRSRDHRIHSSGDYKNPPPPGEHAGLFRHASQISGEAVVVPEDLREAVGRAIIAELKKHGCRILVIAVCSSHVHYQAELPEDKREYRKIVGRTKTAACYAVREQMPGRIWARGATNEPIEDGKHQRNTFYYIRRQPDAWVWTYLEDTEEETLADDLE